MPWCPKCKNEYKAGYTVCADCNTELVESLDGGLKAVYFGSEEELNTICDFLSANGITNSKVVFNEKEGIYELLADEDKLAKVQKMIRVYLQTIAAQKQKEDAAKMQESLTQEELEALLEQRDAHVKEMMRTPYEDAGKKAEDYKSGALSLLIVGVIGVIALVLLNLGMLPISLPTFTKIMITIVMGTMFVIFIVTGLLSRKSYARLMSQADSDKNTKEALLKYLTDSISPEEFDKDLMDDSPSMEILYFRRMEKLKEMVFAFDGGIDPSFAEYILEEVYPEIFE